MRRRDQLLLGLAVTTALLLPAPAWAEEPTVLLMVGDGRRAELFDALRVELAGRGLAVALTQPPQGAEPFERAATARAAAAEAGATYAVWIDQTVAPSGEPDRPVVRVTGRDDSAPRYAQLPGTYQSVAERVFAVVAASLIDELSSPPGTPISAPEEASVAPAPPEPEPAPPPMDQPVAEPVVAGAPNSPEPTPATAPPAPQVQLTPVLFGFDFVPMVGTSLAFAGRDARLLSLNIVGGYAGAVRAFELGAVWNVDRHFVLGAQLAGVFNVDLGWVRGAQVAGVFNTAGDNVAGFQLGGVFNLAMGGVVGAQLTGVLNHATSAVVGLQISGVWNEVMGPVRGFQLAGVGNLAMGDVAGLQLAGVANLTLLPVHGAQISGVFNFARAVRGVQAGLVNVAMGDVGGWQVGLVNYADNSDVSLGLVNVIPGGRLHLDVWGNETGFINLAIKHGGRYLHNIYSVGVQVTDGSWSYGLGIGGHVPILEWLFVDIDLLAHAIEDGAPRGSLNMLSQIRAVVGFRVISWLSIIAGLSYNVLATEVGSGSEYPLFGGSVIADDGRVVVRGWPGFVIGLQLI